MREVLWAAFIVVVGTISFVMWKTSGMNAGPNVSSVTPAAPEPSVPEPVAPVKPKTPPPLPPSEGGDTSSLHTNQAGIDLIKNSEGLRLESYRGPSGAWLIGYGHSLDVRSGMTISAAKAEETLRGDLVEFEDAIKKRVTVPISQNELSAMVSLSYSIGSGSFASSSVLKELNAGNRTKAADAFLLWNKISQGGKLVVSDHLMERRQKERALFLKK